MEGERQLLLVAHSRDMTICLGENFDTRTSRFDVRRADEVLAHHADMADFGLGDEAAELAAVGVAAHGDRQRLEARALIVAQMLCQEDEAGACREYRHALLDPRLDGCEHAAFHEQLALDRALAARQHEGVRLLFEIRCAAQFAALCADGTEHRFVLGKGPLHGKHTNSLCHIIFPSRPSGSRSPLR